MVRLAAMTSTSPRRPERRTPIPATGSPTFRLAAPTPTGAAPVELDEHQRRVVEHEGGPLLVLAGPGTGKTTTLVEAIVDRIEKRGAQPDQVLALTFSRKAAEQLRDRVTARMARTTSSTLCSTFHSFAYGLIRAKAPADLYEGPLRLLSAAEQDVVLQELLTDAPESIRWPDSLRFAVGTRGFAREVQAVFHRLHMDIEAPLVVQLALEFLITVALATLSWHFFERPLLRLGARLTAREGVEANSATAVLSPGRQTATR